MGALVVHGDFDLLPTHIGLRDELPVLVEDRDLRLRAREAGPDEQQPEPGFPGRLRARINQFERRPGRPNATTATVSVDEKVNISDLEVCCAGECVNRGDRLVQPIMRGNVQRRPGGRRHPHPIDHADLVVFDAFLPHVHTMAGTPIGVDDRRRSPGIDPFRAV